MIGGIQAGTLLSAAADGGPMSFALIISCAALGSVLPDIDHAGSKLSRSDGFIGFVSGLLSKMTKHRGFTHTVPGAFVMAAAFYMLAMFRTERESITAFFVALAVFLALHATGDVLRWLAGWIAAGIYVLGPGLLKLITEQGFDLGLNAHSAILCAAGIFAGCIAHDIYDTFNKGGIAWLWPLSSRNIRLARIKTNSAGEGCFAAVQTIILIILLAVFFKDTKAVELCRELVVGFRTLF